ncbi:CRISPR-associated protein [Clostridium liquoris]|uniref:CRISPR-associated protein n=1 Tax=Clostridium liquoris TaxID=1289519 RepID=A0A2T0B2F0_9CLOT|nr:type III-B CRISPR-associated protein Cas10/Cmr2 [Clostridium liquoris]PRR77937.1 CRISPR-associated protein [Clostridium liquoris]
MSESKKSYIGLTIGPIIETISNAKETGELWASSYLFSYIMKNIIGKLLEQDNKLKDKFIVPYVYNEKIFKFPQEVGLFHDRFIFESKDGDFDLVKKSVEQVKGDIINEIQKYEKNSPYEIIEENIDDFLKIYYLEVELDIYNKKDDNNIIFKVNKCLDALELREKLLNGKGMKNNYLLDTLNNKNLKEESFKKHFLSKDAYGEKGKDEEYPCLFKIALGKTYKKDFPNDDDEIKNRLKSDIEAGLQKELIKANEYIAFVQVDGDFMGKVIQGFEINENKEDIYEDYKDFSKKLLEYSKDSNEIIKKYGGFTVYAGGDDLLFIAPIINEKCKVKFQNKNFDNNIFGVIDCLSKVFEDKFQNEKFKEKPSTSFGVAMVHYKFPLYYALDEARELLFSKAKSYRFKNKEKDAIAFKVIKSSGQSFETVVGKSSKSYEEFKALFNSVNRNVDKTKETRNYLKAIHFKLVRDKVILNEIGKDKDLLKNYFDNNFNEKIHKTESIKIYIENLISFIHEIYDEMKDEAKKDECINQIYSYLRFIRFMDEDIKLDDETKKEKGERNE